MKNKLIIWSVLFIVLLGILPGSANAATLGSYSEADISQNNERVDLSEPISTSPSVKGEPISELRCLADGHAVGAKGQAELPRAQDYTKTKYTKELNFVLLHGMGGTKNSMEKLENALKDKVGEEAKRYEQDHPDIDVILSFLREDYPNNVGVDAWAGNIANTINDFWPDKKNLILVGHSMGGKAGLYAVYHNKGGLKRKTLAVVTINSPIRDLFTYGWHDLYYECKIANWAGIHVDKSVCHSIVYHDTRTEANWVGDNKHWLAFVSSENHPNHGKCDFAGADIYGKYMDDAYVPIGAQYTSHADVVYYGSHCHCDCTGDRNVADKIAKPIADYIFGGRISFSAFVGSYYRPHMSPCGVGTNEYEHVVGPNPCPGGAGRDHYEIEVRHESDPGTGINWARWESSNTHDCRVRIESWVTMFLRPWPLDCAHTWIGFTTKVYKKQMRQVCLINEIDNIPPVADAGDNQDRVPDCSTVQLDGSGSYDPDRNPLRYFWEFVSTPAGVEPPALSDPHAVNPTFHADKKAGDYVVKLTVTDPYDASNSDKVKINVVPRAPSNLVLEPLSESEIKLTWTDNSEIEDGFYVYRNGTLIDETVTNETSYTDKGVEPCTEYEYYVTAFAARRQSDLSNTATALTKLNIPTNLVAKAIAHDEILLSWRDNSHFEEGYEIWMTRDGTYMDEDNPIYTTGSDEESCLVTDLDTLTTYCYKVRAIDEIPSEFSEGACATTFPYMVSDMQDATAWNNGDKLVVAPDGTICLVYAAEASIWYTESQDGGEHWSKHVWLNDEVNLYDCANPSIAVSNTGRRLVVFSFASNTGIAYVTSDDGKTWSGEILHKKEKSFYPSVAYDFKGKSHICWVSHSWVSHTKYGESKLYYYQNFRLWPSFPMDIGEIGPHSRPFSTVAVTVKSIAFGDRVRIEPHPHILWVEYISIPDTEEGYYLIRHWDLPPRTLVAGNVREVLHSANSTFPSISAGPGDTLYATWFTIPELAIKFASYDGTNWSEPVTLESKTGKALFSMLKGDATPCPVIANLGEELIVVWGQSDGIYYVEQDEWSSPKKIAGSYSGCIFPHAAFSLSPDGNPEYLYVLWTNINTSPYKIKFNSVYLYPVVTVEEPNGGENWACDSVHMIHWEAEDNLPEGITSQKIYYSYEYEMVSPEEEMVPSPLREPARKWIFIDSVSGDVRSYEWKVPPTPSAICKVKVVAYDKLGNSGYDISDSCFTISDQTPPDVELIHPEKGENLGIGQEYTITWHAEDNVGISRQELWYSYQPGMPPVPMPSLGPEAEEWPPRRWIQIDGSLPGDIRRYDWIVPSTPSTTCRVKVIAWDEAGNSSFSTSSGDFTISDQTPPDVELIHPEKGEKVEVGQEYTITWEATDNLGVARVDIFISRKVDENLLEILLEKALPGDVSTYVWEVPAKPSDDCKITVTAYDAVGNYAADSVCFSIPEPWPWWRTLIIILAVIVIAGLTYYFVRRRRRTTRAS